MVGWNYMNPDYPGYKIMYNSFGIIDSVSSSEFEFGYRVLMLAGNVIGLDYQQFFITISGIILFLWFRFINFFSKSPAIFVFFFYFIFIPLDYVMVRNTLAFSIVIQGFISILNYSKFKYIKYILLVLVASTIHISSLFYLLLLCAFRSKKLNVTKIILIVGFTFFLFILMKQYLIGIVHSQIEGRMKVYQTSYRGFLLYSAIQIVNVFVMIYFYNNRKKQLKLSGGKIAKGMDEVIINVNIVLLFLIVLYSNAVIMVRLFRYFAIINVMYIANMLYGTQKIKVKWVDLYIFIPYIFFFFLVFIVTQFDRIFLSLYKYNIIF
jgi:hypothetical protein